MNAQMCECKQSDGKQSGTTQKREHSCAHRAEGTFTRNERAMEETI